MDDLSLVELGADDNEAIFAGDDRQGRKDVPMPVARIHLHASRPIQGMLGICSCVDSL